MCNAAVTPVPSAPPEFEDVPEDKVAAQKEDVAFRCSATGAPQPLITWTKNGERLDGSDYFKVGAGWLQHQTCAVRGLQCYSLKE